MADTSTPTIIGGGKMPIERSAPWAVNFYSVDFTGGVLNAELKAAPTRDNSATYLTHVTMGIVANASKVLVDANLTLYDGIGEAVFGPVQFITDGTTVFSKDFSKPLKITDKKALDVQGICADTGYQSACFIFIEGFTGDKSLG